MNLDSTPTPVGPIDQQHGGGIVFRPSDSSGNLPVEQPPLASHQDPTQAAPPSSQPHFLASSSDDLFHPDVGGPSYVPYRLPPVPNIQSYNLHYPHLSHNPPPSYIPNHRTHLSQPPPRILPYPSSASSYHNPTFTVPNPHYHPHSEHHPNITARPLPQPISSSVPLYHPPPILADSSPLLQPNPPLHAPHSVPDAYVPFSGQTSIPVQYVYYVPTSSSVSSSTSSSKTLPSVTHLPTLTNKLDFFAWDEGVTALLRAHGLFGHIMDPSAPPDPSRPDLTPVPLPVLSPTPSSSELAALTRWWEDDNAAQHVLLAKVNPTTRGLLPASNMVARTALMIYQTLVRYHGTCSFSDCAVLMNTLYATPCQPGRVQEFVSKWRTGLSRIQSARFPFSIRMCLNQFVCGLPNIPAFNSLRSDLPARITNAHDQDFGAFVALTESALELDTIFRSILPQPRTRSQVPPPSVNPSLSTPSHTPATSLPGPTITPATGTASYLQKLCSNCGRKGHLVPTCFAPGGGMEGRQAEFKRDRTKVMAMLLADLDESLASDDIASLSSPDAPTLDSLPLDTLDDHILVPHMANLSISSTVLSQNDNLSRDLYIMRDSTKSSPYVLTNSVEFDHTAYLSLGGRFNSCLDSGCTDHIITDRRLFQTYDTSGAVEIGTANCGSLSAKASGDVSFRVPYRDRFVTFTLRSCLHAPDAPINLLSVGALNERGMTVTFNTLGAPTILSYPPSDPILPGFSLSAEVIRRLSFLNLDFVYPSTSSPPSAFPALTFPKTKYTSTLWHRRFGHLGMDATREALTKHYAVGIQYTGPFTQEHCIACIIGKSPQHSYSHNGHRASKVAELLHMDLCGPYPTQTPDGKRYFYTILDDFSNWGFTYLLCLKSDVFTHFSNTEAFLLRSYGTHVITVRTDGALELCKGELGDHFVNQGIVVQQTAPYAHQQAGKIERYVRTIEEGGQTLLADSGLPMSFWGWAVLTSQYLRNRLPTSTLASDFTPFEVLTGKKPDLSHLRVWGCQCFPAIPPELRTKAGPRRFDAIFVGYEEARVGWVVRDLKGAIHFSRDVIFNEDISGRLGVPKTILSSSDSEIDTRPARERILTAAGRAYDEVLRLKESRRLERTRKVMPDVVDATHSGATALCAVEDVAASGVVRCDVADVVLRAVGDVAVCGVASHFEEDAAAVLCAVGDVTANGGVLCVDEVVMVSNGDVDVVSTDGDVDRCVADDDISDVHIVPTGISDLTPSEDVYSDILSFLAPSNFRDHDSLDCLASHEFDILWRHCFSARPHAPSPNLPPSQRFPLSYAEAIARPDASVWRAAMDREMMSLREMGAFVEEDLPKGEKTVGLKWVYAYKTDAAGDIILGKEKARLVAQGFNQRPGQFDETYAPVAKMTSIRILLAWAASKDLEIFQFDCKTAFLHAKVRHPIYARPFPGYTPTTLGKVLRILVALYGLRQSAYEFYILFMSLLLGLGMIRCEVDHGIFLGIWTSPPHPSIPMPTDGSSLVLYVPLHVDDGLGITNSPSLYKWFLATLSKRLHVVDLGVCSKFLSISIIHDRPNRRLWLSSHIYISELLDEWNLSSCKVAPTPFPSKITEFSSVPAVAVPALDTPDPDLTVKYQRIVGCLLYLAVSTRPDLSYYAMWLGQYNSKPSRAHFLIAKHVLRYLAGTKTLALRLGSPSASLPAALSSFMQNVGCSDADWASDTVDRRSISGYSFYFASSLISWSATKQKSIALSSTEAEYYALSHAFKEALWLRAFLGLLHFPVPRPFPILSDNQAACSLSNSSAISTRSKHIDIRHHFIRAHVQDGSFTTTWIPTADMPADIFTKPLPFVIFNRHREVLGLSIPFA